MSTTAPRGPVIRTGAMTPAQRRIAKAPDLAPGGPPTLRSRVANQFIKAMLKSAWQKSPDTDAGLLRMRRAADRMTRFQTLPRGVAIEPQDLGDRTAEWVWAVSAPEGSGAGSGKGGVVLYLHGGGYFFGGPRLYRPFNWRLSAATGHPVLALDYRLAPEHTPADALEDALAAYEFLLGDGYEPAGIVVGGDSAGGHLTLALLLALKDRGRPLPRAAVLLSPWADLLCTAESHTLNARTDCLIPAAKLAWLGRRFCAAATATATAGAGAGGDGDGSGRGDGSGDGDGDGSGRGDGDGGGDGSGGDALHAPVRGDYAGLPPLLVIASGSEILRDDARLVAERARAVGVQVEHQEWAGLAHVFPVFADFMPEGKAAFRHIAEFLDGTTS